jgi:hypothetical protein
MAKGRGNYNLECYRKEGIMENTSKRAGYDLCGNWRNADNIYTKLNFKDDLICWQCGKEIKKAEFKYGVRLEHQCLGADKHAHQLEY